VSLTGRAAVLGSPIEHSLSPILHLAAYQALGLNWDYGRFEVQVDELAGFVTELDELWRGISLTMPLKAEAVRIAQQVDDIAGVTGAANTLVRMPLGGWIAYNTDVVGMVRAIETVAPERRFPRVVILGAGATARSAVAASRDLGAEEVIVAARRVDAAEEVLAVAVALGLGARAADLKPRAVAADLVISTLPADAAAPWAEVAAEYSRAVLLDVTYAPWPTTLARAWCGAVASGAHLLLWQATEQVRLMTGRAAPVEAMRAALARYPQA
jgi:shikimate dehydrogenase